MPSGQPAGERAPLFRARVRGGRQFFDAGGSDDRGIIYALTEAGRSQFPQAYVIAHEVGHHVQNLIGANQIGMRGETRNQSSVRLELQADCLATPVKSGPKATASLPKIVTFRDWLLSEASSDLRRLKKVA